MARVLDIRPLTASRDDLENNYATKPLSPAELCIEADRRDTWVGDASENTRIGIRPYYAYVQGITGQSHNQRSYQDASPSLNYVIPCDGIYEIVWSCAVRASSLNHKMYVRAVIGASVIGESYQADIDGADAIIFCRYLVSLSAGNTGTVTVQYYANRGTQTMRDLHISIERKF